MGRADLARHRKSSLSDAKPAGFPETALWVLQHVDTHPNRDVACAISSVRNAPTQRAQVVAVKMLGVVLRDSLSNGIADSGKTSRGCMQHENIDEGSDNPFSSCDLIVPILLGFLFETPDATAGLTSTALRAILRCQHADIPKINVVVDSFLARLESAQESYSGKCTDSFRFSKHSTPANDNFAAIAADVSAASVCLADPASRHWILNHPKRITGSLEKICTIIEIYVLSSRNYVLTSSPLAQDETTQADPPKISNGEPFQLPANRKLLESACDSSMKAAQEIFNALARTSDQELSLRTPEVHARVKATLHHCSQILRMPMAPRNCATACAVVYISGLIFNANCAGSPQQIASTLRQHVLDSLSMYPPFSQLCLLRAAMEASVSKPALPLLLFPTESDRTHQSEKRSLFDFLSTLASANADVHLRFLAMDTLIVCLRRKFPEKLSVRCRNTVLALIRERWQEPFPGVSGQIRDAMDALIAIDGGDEESRLFWVNMASTLVKGDWQFKSMYAPLTVLVKRIGAQEILQLEANCQSRAILATGVDTRLAKPVADWLEVFWKALVSECNKSWSRFHELTCKPIVAALMDESSHMLRERVSEYVLPAYFRAVGKEIEKSANALLDVLHQLSIDKSISQMRGTVIIMSASRKHGVFVGSFSDRHIIDLLRDALRSGDEEMRSSALELIATSRTSTEPVLQEELDLVLSHLPVALMPGSSPSFRSRLRHIMRRFFERLAACQKAASAATGGWWAKERKMRYGGVRTAEYEERRQSLLTRVSAFQRSCVLLFMSSIYPGAAFTRRTTALELLTLLSKNLGFHTFSHPLTYPPEQATASLLVCVLDSWERPRRAALEAVTDIPVPVAGLDTKQGVLEIQQCAVPLLDSPRQKDVDSGALLCRIIFRKHILGTLEQNSNSTSPTASKHKAKDMQTGVVFPQNYPQDLEDQSMMARLPFLPYAESVLTSLESILVESHSNFSKMCEDGLFHGRCLLLRYIIQDLPWKEISKPCNQVVIRSFVNRILDVFERCAFVAMEGVSFKAFSQNEFDGGEDDEEAIFMNESKKLISTSCFLSAKEICVSLGILCHAVPFSHISTQGEDDGGILSKAQLEHIGSLYKHVFMNTRHWGVIDGAEEGFQLLCEQLLQSAGTETRLLPQTWVSETIASALQGKLYVLRRSAGIPAMISAVVNAEAGIRSLSHESPLLNGVVTALLEHLAESDLFIDERLLSQNRSKSEESVAHALNLLRSLFQNGNVSATILKYLEPAMIKCIEAFRSASWLIRNSAMMLFSALIRRGIGVCVEREKTNAVSSFEAVDGTSATIHGRRLHGVSAFQFFSRHPKLHPFLLEQLQTALNQFNDKATCDYPALYPTLYLLSSLSPAAADDPSANLSMQPFRAILRECAHWRSDYVRRAAAAASVPLIEDPSRVANVLEDILLSVPAEPSHAICPSKKEKSKSRGIIEISETVPIQLLQNHLHGDLLTIIAIMKGTERIMSPGDKIATINALASLLPNRVWIARDEEKNSCSVTRSAMLTVLEKSFLLACDLEGNTKSDLVSKRSCTDVIHLCMNVAISLHEQLHVRKKTASNIGIAAYHASSARLLSLSVSRAFEKDELSLGDSLEFMLDLVSSMQNESAQIALDHIVLLLPKFIERRTAHSKNLLISSEEQSSLSQLYCNMQNLLQESKNDSHIVSALRVLCELMQHFGSDIASANNSNTCVTSLIKLADSHPCVDIRENAIILLGYMVHLKPLDAETLNKWMQIVEYSSSSRNPPSTRTAACTAVSWKNLLSRKDDKCKKVDKELSVRSLLVLSRSLQDDNGEVRLHAAEMVHRLGRSSFSRRCNQEGVLPSLMTIFNELSTTHDRSPFLFNYMSSLLGDSPIVQDELMELLRLVTKPDGNITWQQSRENPGKIDPREEAMASVSRLFRLENDCETEETVLELQLVAYCYYQIIMAEKSIDSNVSSADVARLCEQLVTELRVDIERNKRNVQGAVLNTESFGKEGFQHFSKRVLRLFLTVICLQSCPDSAQGKSYLSNLRDKLAEVVDIARPFLHPTIVCGVDAISMCMTVRHSPAESLRRIQPILFLLEL